MSSSAELMIFLNQIFKQYEYSANKLNNKSEIYLFIVSLLKVLLVWKTEKSIPYFGAKKYCLNRRLKSNYSIESLIGPKA